VITTNSIRAILAGRIQNTRSDCLHILYRVPSAPCPSRAQSLPQGLFPLMSVIGERPFFGRQVREKAEASDAIDADSLAIDPRVTPYEIAQVIPVEFHTMLEFVDEASGFESIARLPQLQHNEPADERLIERAGCVYSEVINVARLVTLITGADLFGKDFGQCETVDFSRSERQWFEITLFRIAAAAPALASASRGG